MKKTLLLTAMVFITTLTFGQSIQKTIEQQSNADIFSQTSGTLIQKEFIDIGKANNTKIQVAIFTDLISGKKTSAIRFEKVVFSAGSSDTKIGTIDADELDGLIKSLHIINDKIFPTTVVNYTEVNFNARGGFSAGCFWSKTNWSSFIKIEKYDGDSYEFLSKKSDFDNLLLLLEQAKTKLI